VAGQFVRETRFDPRHGGASEQALHDALPRWLGELCLRPALPATLRAGGIEHTIELTRPSLVTPAADLYRGLAEQVSLLKRAGEPATVLLSHRAARLPGLLDRLQEIRGVTIVELQSSAAVSGTLQHRDRLRRADEALPFVTRLPSGLAERERPAPPVTVPRAPSWEPMRATHVLVDGIAHAIGARGLALGTAPPQGMRGLVLRGDTTGISRHHCTLQAADGEAVVEDHSSWGTFVNGERVAGRAVLSVGDRLRLGSPGVELLLIAVEG
jgi:FHA domain